MTAPLQRALGCLALLAMTASCALQPVGAGYNPDVGYGATFATDPGYYSPFGVDYGGWDSGFAVGPFGRDGGDRYRGGDRNHGFRPAPGGQRVPSIPQGGGRPGGHAGASGGGVHVGGQGGGHTGGGGGNHAGGRSGATSGPRNRP